MRRSLISVMLAATLALARFAAAQTAAVTTIVDARPAAKRALIIALPDHRGRGHSAIELSRGVELFTAVLRDRYGFPARGITLVSDVDDNARVDHTSADYVRRAVGRFISSLPKQSDVIVLYTGRGVRSLNSDWMVPQGGDVNRLAETCVGFDDIKRRIAQKAPAHALFLVDTQFEYRDKRDADSQDPQIGPAQFGQGFTEIRACQQDEHDWPAKPPDFTESVFLHYLVAGLAGAPGAQRNGSITFDSLFQYVRSGVSAYVDSRYGEYQTPVYQAKSDVQMAAGMPPRPDGDAALANGPPQDDLPTNTKPNAAIRIVFVVDVSGSVLGLRLRTAVREAVQKAISELRPTDSFDVIAFANWPAVLRPDLMAPTKENITLVRLFLDDAHSGNGTRISTAMECAFAVRHVNRIVLISDGEANRDIDNPKALREFLTRTNRRHVQVSTIALGGPSSAGTRLLSEIAADQHGSASILAANAPKNPAGK